MVQAQSWTTSTSRTTSRTSSTRLSTPASTTVHSAYSGKKSYNFLFDSDRELKFWRLQNIFKDERKSDEDVLSTCAFLNPANISMFQMFDFSARTIEIADVVKFYSLKSQLQAKMDMDRNN